MNTGQGHPSHSPQPHFASWLGSSLLPSKKKRVRIQVNQPHSFLPGQFQINGSMLEPPSKLVGNGAVCRYPSPSTLSVSCPYWRPASHSRPGTSYPLTQLLSCPAQGTITEHIKLGLGAAAFSTKLILCITQAKEPFKEREFHIELLFLSIHVQAPDFSQIIPELSLFQFHHILMGGELSPFPHLTQADTVCCSQAT